jgi:hypothetical protein
VFNVRTIVDEHIHVTYVKVIITIESILNKITILRIIYKKTKMLIL